MKRNNWTFSLIGVTAGVLSTLTLGSCDRTPPPPPDVLLVTIDTLRGDRWGCTGDPKARTPFVDKVARRGLLAFEGRAPAPITLPSHATIMTGLAPVSHEVRDNGIFRLSPTQGKTLAEVLREAGYATAAFVASYPLSARFGLDRGFDLYDDYLGADSDEAIGQLRERKADEVVARVRRAFDRGKIPAAEIPFFLWVHFFDPHAPYEASHWSDALGGDGYRAEIASTDREMNRLLRELEVRRPGNAWRMFITSDHGEGLGEHGELSHGVLLHSSTLRVPFVATGGKQKPALTGVPFSLERIPNTILENLGISGSLHPSSAPSLNAPPSPVLSETMYPWFNYGWRALRSWENSEWKLVSGETDRLYRPREDPQERNDLAAFHPEVVAEIKNNLFAEWEKRRAFAFDAQQDSLSTEDIEALRSLGYAAGGGGDLEATEKAFVSGADPEVRIHTVDLINRAITLLGNGDAAQAAAILEDQVENDPQSRLGWEFLGRARLMQKNFKSARECLLRALALGRNPASVFMDLAQAERRLGSVEGERRALQAAVATDPQLIPARHALFRIALLEGDREEALRILQEAEAIRPRSESTQMNLAQYFEMVGDREKARQHWQRALELDPEGAIGLRARQALAQWEESGS